LTTKSNRLGKGLEALIPDVSGEVQPTGMDSLSDIDVSTIERNPQQPRTEFNENALEGLKKSIQENGVIQPITVRKTDSGYELIAGERRLRAVQELGYKKIPAFIMQITSEDQMLEMALVENIQREDLNPIELARAYQQLQKEHGLTQEQVAVKVGKDRATIANFIRLLKLPRQIRESLQKNEISMGHARALMGLPSDAQKIRLWKKSVKQDYSVRKVEEAVRALLEAGKGEAKLPAPAKDPQLLEIEEQLRTIMGTQVRIKTSSKGGKIEITYYSNDDLDRLLDLFDTING
jgi:ParB family chromosome partitioning protein